MPFMSGTIKGPDSLKAAEGSNIHVASAYDRQGWRKCLLCREQLKAFRP